MYLCGFGVGLGMHYELGFTGLVVPQLPIILQGKTPVFKKTSYTGVLHSALICNHQVSFSMQNICTYVKQDCFQDI